MNKDEFEKYYESAEANEDSKSDTKVILFFSCYSYDLLG